ncbi:MAG: hypothetical protein ACO1TE_25445 [Prosthecobacter sp.]
MKPTLLALMMLSMGLLSGGARDETDYDITSEHEALREAAKHAIAEGDIPLFDMLLKAGLQINKPLDPNYKKYALHLAVEGKQPDMIRHLRKLGANPLLRNNAGNRPIDDLPQQLDGKLHDLVTALTREPTAYDKKLLMQIPLPVWHEIFGEPGAPPDPLAPPSEGMDGAGSVPFVSINGGDPLPEMTPALNAHYPGWRPGSRAEEDGGTAERAPLYRDKQTHEPGRIIQITLVPCPLADVVDRSGSLFAALKQDEGKANAYQFKVRQASGPIMAGGGWGGYVVPVAGYWMKVGTRGWDE